MRRPLSCMILIMWAVGVAGEPWVVSGGTAAVSNAARLVYLTSPGCPDCRRVDDLLATLQRTNPGLHVDVHNLHHPDAVRYAEALAARFEVPLAKRLVAPAVVGPTAYLVRDAIDAASLVELLDRSEHAANADWWRIDADELAAAGGAIASRGMAAGVGVVLAAGLLDGVNPCALATLVFLLSYLQVARRSRRDVLYVGMGFIMAVFIAYSALGLGLAAVVTRLDSVRWASRVMTAALSGVALLLAVLSLRDGVLCLRGRMADMTLQLPDALNRRIHSVIRRQARHPLLVLSAVAAGLVIAVLELACTGQVYAPTILFMIRTGSGTGGTLVLLVVYNLAFILPLVMVFGLAWGGMRSETLGRVMRRHAAGVKFGTAALFFGLAMLLMFGQ